MQSVQELLNLIQLEQIDDNIFRGENYQAPWGRVFGGQVLSQSLNAASRTVLSERKLHSIHAYFILPGDLSVPIVYEVDRIRDGGSFTTRRVIAIQKGRPIFNMSASFQLEQEGFDHALTMPDVSGPENLASDVEILKAMPEVPRALRSLLIPRPFEFRPVEPLRAANDNTEPLRHVWLKAKSALPDDLALHKQLLAYSSDYNLLATALLPHRQALVSETLQLASLDHAMWFHREFSLDEWLLFVLESPSASGARGFTRGSFFTQEGKLAASVVQEGLMRIKQ